MKSHYILFCCVMFWGLLVNTSNHFDSIGWVIKDEEVNLLLNHMGILHLKKKKKKAFTLIFDLIYIHETSKAYQNSNTNKTQIDYHRSFLSNHFFRAVTSMATNILAFLSSSKSSQASKKSPSSMSGTV